MARKVFISYRRADTAPIARVLYDRFATILGRKNVFLDVDTINPGENFHTKIDTELAASDTVVVLMGPRWLETGSDGVPRIQNEADAVRKEVRTALKRGCRVLPILVDYASMPSASQLPADIQALVDINAMLLRHDSFDRDADRLIRQALKIGETDPIWREQGSFFTKLAYAAAGSGVGFVALVALAAGYKMATRTALEGQLGYAGVQASFILATGVGLLLGLWWEQRRRRLSPGVPG
jgi:hypothetical protein